ncbi:MAG: hypothetical protein ACXVGB_06135 [Mycobacteriaceae bacterium]
MSSSDNSIAAYFADLVERRDASLADASAELARSEAAGQKATAEIAKNMREAVATAEEAAHKERTQQINEKPPVGWPSRDEDVEKGFLRALSESENSEERS